MVVGGSNGDHPCRNMAHALDGPALPRGHAANARPHRAFVWLDHICQFCCASVHSRIVHARAQITPHALSASMMDRQPLDSLRKLSKEPAASALTATPRVTGPGAERFGVREQP